MTAALLPLLVALPLLAAGALVVVPGRTRIGTAVLLTALALSAAGGVVLVADQMSGEVIAHSVGLWPVGIAIPFAADMLSALLLTVTAVLSLVCSIFAMYSGFADRTFFAPLVLVLTAGVNGALLTADLFNLFVFIEVMLLPSYALMVLSAVKGGATTSRVSGTRLYVTVNLLTSTVFLAGVAFVYGAAGTVNLAELAGAARQSPSVAIASAVCLFALSIKASVFPVHGWLARTYPAAAPAVTALFSGLHTKVAIYAIYRVYAVVFDGDERYLWVGVVAFSLTMIVGVLGAVGESITRSILAFHMVSQIGYILLGVALFGPLGLAAGIFYLIHHMIVKASLFLSTGAIEVRYGTGQLGRLKEIARREPLVAVAFFAAALSLAGLPPFSGFVAKLSLITAAFDAGQVTAAVVVIVVSLITLLSMLKIWSGTFWGAGPSDTATDDGSGGGEGTVITRPTARIGIGLLAPSLVLAAATLALGLGAQGLLMLTDIAANQLIDTSSYVEAVTR
ncbi:monovalent cation/H+ antiporter subunit D family protein [Rhodococcoides fascians]|uniref:monovalent cation/H+ antiporter subunit D family protein n=1 Tax=Rhodococcoides fascians TaxID=1828 RepID=UPI00056D2165|nr:monovalent cation/H+ antiporter subunit D family protein [Rhodococcus fascians]